jgi:nucleotide-binding universal stress UspA family protein
MSPSQILVPLDTSETAEAALPVAELLAAHSDARLHLVAVRMSFEPGQTRELYAYLEHIASAERGAGRQVRTTLRIGDPAEAILMLERELGIDLVVMATHGRRGLRRLLLGSVADRVVRASRVPGGAAEPRTTRPGAPAHGTGASRRHARWSAGLWHGRPASAGRSLEGGRPAGVNLEPGRCGSVRRRRRGSISTSRS